MRKSITTGFCRRSIRTTTRIPTSTFVQERDATYEEYNKIDQDTANRSTFVRTDVRDAIMLMLPSLIRLFGASESPIELVPRTADDSDMATQATQFRQLYVLERQSWLFNSVRRIQRRNDGENRIREMVDGHAERDPHQDRSPTSRRSKSSRS